MKFLLSILLGLAVTNVYAGISEASISGMVNQQLEVNAKPLNLPLIRTVPVSSNGKVLGLGTADQNKLANHYAFAVFFLSTCPHCARFLPILKDYAKEHGIEVFPFSTDGPGEADYPNPLPVNPKIMQRFDYPQSYPALYLVSQDDPNATPIPITQGEESEMSLNQQMQSIAAQLGENL